MISLGECEEPGFAKGDQGIWHVINDLDTSKANRLGSDPMGLIRYTALVSPIVVLQPMLSLRNIIYHQRQ